MRSLLQSYLCTPNQTLLAAPDFRQAWRLNQPFSRPVQPLSFHLHLQPDDSKNWTPLPGCRCCALIAELHRQHEERSNDQGMAAEAAEADTYTRSDRAEALAQLKDQLQLESLVQVRLCFACFVNSTLPVKACIPQRLLSSSPRPQEHGSAICIHFIASHPEWRGQGLGAKMMCHICQLADRGHKPLYLEATSARSQVGVD